MLLAQNKSHDFSKLIPFIASSIIMLGFTLRLYDLAKESLWYDELLQLDIAQQPLVGILPALPRHAAVPLDYLTTHFWILLGRQEYWVRLPAVLLGTLTLPLAYQFGRKLLGAGSSGLLFMLLLTVSPFHVRYSQEVRPYAWLLLGVILAGYAFWQFRRTGRWRHLLLLQVGVLIFSLSHFFAIVIFGPWLLFAGLDAYFNPARRQAVKALVGLLITGFVALVILLSLGWGQTFVKVSTLFGETLVDPEQFVAEPTEKPNQGLGPTVDVNFVKYQILTPLGGGGTDTTLQFFNGLAGLGLIYLLLYKRYKLVLFLVLWIFLPIITIVAFLLHRGEFFASRYILSVLPAYLILVTVGLLALPRWLRCADPRWLSLAALLLLSGVVFVDMAKALDQTYKFKEKEDWRLVTEFIRENVGPHDAVLAVNAESTMNWYYPPATAPLDTYDDLETIKATVTQAERSWVVVSFFTTYLGERDAQIKVWLSEQGAIRLLIDPLIAVYYLGPPGTDPDQLLAEIQGFALPVDHALYASLARENRRQPEVARQYYRLAIDNSPNDEVRVQYQADLEALSR
jgi:4-amino-4-deoxy-L-arabinose transferase-like glycosyltransferase